MARKARRTMWFWPVTLVAVAILSVALWESIGGRGESDAALTTDRQPAGEQVAGEPASGTVDSPTADVGESPATGEAGAAAPASRLSLRIVRWPDGKRVAGATVRVASGDHLLAAEGRPSLDGYLELGVPNGIEALTVTASAPGHGSVERSLLVEDLGSRTVLMELRPTTGWIGRVVSSHGVPLAGAHVVARRYWPPRPAYLDDGEGEVHLTSVQATAPAQTGGVTNATGHFYVEPFRDDNVVDLVLSVVDEQFASERVHIPLPFVGQQLPDLVTFGASPLTGQVVDSSGYPVPHAVLQVDRGPGQDRYIEESLVADDEGRFRVNRVFSAQHLRVTEDRSWFLGGRTQGQELPLRDGWVRVEPGAPWVTLVLDPGGMVAGQLLDAASSQPIRDGRAVLRAGQGLTLASGLSDAEGHFELLLPPEDIGRRVQLRLSAVGYERWTRDTTVEPRLRAHQLPEYLSPGLGTQRIHGVVQLLSGGLSEAEVLEHPGPGEPAEGVVVRAYIATRGGPVGSWVLEDGLPSEFELVWEGVSDDAGAFSFIATADPSTRLVVISEMAAPEGALHLGQWGPQPLSAAAGGISFLQSYGQSVTVDVGGLEKGRRYLVQQTSWNPWTQSSWSGAVPFPVESEGWATISVQTATKGAAFFDVRVDRGPVSAPVASSTGWLELEDIQTQRIEIPPLRSVSGELRWFADGDWPDLCLAFVGDAVPTWRSEWVGESDWCVRPDKDGRFHLPELPPREYSLMLYRPLGDEGVEVLAEQTVSVTSDLFRLDAWPQRPAFSTEGYSSGR